MSLIPKIIMQTWKTDILPEHWQSSQNAIKKLHPDWKYVLMTDEDNKVFVKKHFPWFYDKFMNFQYPIQRADAIRYMWLYVNGGVYVDLDLEPVQNIEELFNLNKYKSNNLLFLCRSTIVNSIFTNAFMACTAGLKIMIDCVHEMFNFEYTWQVGKHLKVVNSTGPNMLTRVINNNDNKNNRDDKDNIILVDIPTELIVACGLCDIKPCVNKNGYFKLLGGSSWTGSDSDLLASVYCNAKAVKESAYNFTGIEDLSDLNLEQPKKRTVFLVVAISLIVFIIILLLRFIVMRKARK